MLYLLLIVPHTIALAAMLWWAYCTSDRGAVDEPYAGYGDGGQDSIPPGPPPAPAPAGAGPPLPHAGQPARRVRVGERLADLYPGRDRRPHPARVPQPAAADGPPERD